jgi:hypothetical protein
LTLVHQIKNWLNDASWWHRAVSALWEANPADDDFILRIKSSLGQEAEAAGLVSITRRFKNLVGLRATIMMELDNIDKKRQGCLEALDALSETPIVAEVIDEVLACSRCRGSRNRANEQAEEQAEHDASVQKRQPRRNVIEEDDDVDNGGKKKVLCRYCRVEEHVIDYETALFVFKQQRKKTTNEQSELLNKMDSEVERILNRLASVREQFCFLLLYGIHSDPLAKSTSTLQALRSTVSSRRLWLTSQRSPTFTSRPSH